MDGFHPLTFYDLGLLCIGQRPTVAAETSGDMGTCGSFVFIPVSNVSFCMVLECLLCSCELGAELSFRGSSTLLLVGP